MGHNSANVESRYEQAKRAFLHARSHATAWDFMDAAIIVRAAEHGEDGMEDFAYQLMDWTILILVGADSDQPAAAA
jgi:hypothetical protein